MSGFFVILHHSVAVSVWRNEETCDGNALSRAQLEGYPLINLLIPIHYGPKEKKE